MASDPDYERSAETAAQWIQEMVPGDLAGLFSSFSGISRGDFQTCRKASCGEICAVDGSNSMILESGGLALVLFRGAQCTFRDRERTSRSLTPLQFGMIGPLPENEEFLRLYEECFGNPPGTPLGNDDRVKAAGVLRDTVEYWVMHRMAASLHEGALLLRDGPLRVSHASHDPVLTGIEQICRMRGIDLAGVSKQTPASWGGGHPLIPSVQALALDLGIPAPWWIRIDPAILDHAQFPQWQHGEIYIARLHPKARSPLKIELVPDIPGPRAGGIMERLAACSGDGRIPGYPYPLFDAHRTVVLTGEMMEQARSDILRRISGAGIGRETFEILFGDYHDEFARY